MPVGIERLSLYPGRCSLDVAELFEVRGLDTRRFGNLMMERKSVNMPCEDPVSNAVNAAKPIIDALHPAEVDRIDAVIVGTESGLDFGKPISTYVQRYLGLPEHCRSFEVKHACYGGTAAVQCAAALVSVSPGMASKALVIAADAASTADRNTYWEPSQGAGAVAMLIGSDPAVLALDPGANGFCSYEVMDTFRPRPELEAGDSDLSLLSYLRCLEQSYHRYAAKVRGCDFVRTFDRLVFHAPFAGMVKGAHRTVMRKLTGAPQEEIDRDFQRRMEPSLRYCTQLGNLYGAALYTALCSLIDNGELAGPARVGVFSYGSGCASEFYSGVISPAGRDRVRATGTDAAIAARVPLTMPEYELVSDLSVHRMAGVREAVFDTETYSSVYDKAFTGQGLLVLDRITDFQRTYRWS